MNFNFLPLHAAIYDKTAKSLLSAGQPPLQSILLSTLPLFVLRIFADYHYATFTPDNLAFFTNRLY
jgi:hypothetical protein